MIHIVLVALMPMSVASAPVTAWNFGPSRSIALIVICGTTFDGDASASPFAQLIVAWLNTSPAPAWGTKLPIAGKSPMEYCAFAHATYVPGEDVNVVDVGGDRVVTTSISDPTTFGPANVAVGPPNVALAVSPVC